LPWDFGDSFVTHEELNPEQLQAVKTIEGPLLIVAGAGSGKTRVITYRIAYMLEKHIPQNQILALTFTNKAAREMEHRVKDLTGKKLTNLTVSTFHSFGLQVLREQAAALGYKEHLTVYDTTDSLALIRESARELDVEFENSEVQTLASLFSSVKNGQRSLESLDSSFQKIFQEYNEHLKLFNAVDFDDLITKPYELWTKFPEILEAYRHRFKYILVDEFQDTSLNQYQLVQLLAHKHRNLCVVGDDDQSIYSWRGANYRNIQEFEKDFPERVEIKLVRNYRSTGTILAAANAVIVNNQNRKDKQLVAQRTGGTEIEIHYPENETEEAEFIVRTIKALFVRENRPYSDFGILVRTNSLTRNIEMALLRDKVPYALSGGTSFMERKEIKDVVSYLRTLLNSNDDLHFLRILNTPRRGLGKAVLEHIDRTARSRGLSAFEAARLLGRPGSSQLTNTAAADLSLLVDLIERYRTRIGNGVGRKNAELVKELLEEINFEDFLFQENTSPKAAEWRWQNVQQFIQFLSDWESDALNDYPALSVFLNRMTLTNREDEGEANKGAVNLMTIHSAKGLEFPVVFLAGVEDGILPHARSLEENAEGFEEERRLFYVAITRAQQKLFLTSCQNRRNQKGFDTCTPSPFLKEIPAQLLRQVKDYDTFEEGEMEKMFENLKKKLGI